jgi:hypothetical protein
MADFLAGLKQVTSTASKPFNDVVARLDKGAAESGGVTEQDPAEMLNEIALDEELQTAFAPVLSQLGFEIKADEILDSMGDSRKITTALRNSKITFYVAYIPKLILEDGSKKNRGAFNLLEFLFQEGSVAYIISRDLWAMDPDFDPVLTRWKSKLIYASFVPWNHVMKFLSEVGDPKSNTQKRVHRMKQMLKLDELQIDTSPPPVAASTELTLDEKEEVITMITQHAGITQMYDPPQVFFRDLASRAALPGRENLTWPGNARVAAGQLIDTVTAMTYPVGHERAGQNTLGWVLFAFANYPMPPQSSKRLLELILKHNLIGDRAKMEELRRRVANIPTGGPSE